jgi:ABC-type sugar transport system ATPase subunit
VRRRALEARAQQLIDEHAFPLQASWRVDRLSPAGRQMVEILRALAHEARLLIFDEPTSSLSDAETREVFRLVQALKARGSSVIYITHRMEELRHLGDRVTVLRDGETVFTGEMSGISTSEIIRHMVGRELETIYQREAVPPGAELLRVEHLSRAGVLSDISFSIRAGEIVGLAGLIGAGRTELCRALFGIDPVDSGRILLAGREVHIRSPRDAVRAGIGLVPEDRGRTGLATGLSVAHNMLLASLRAYSASGVMLPAREKSAVESFSQRLRIRISSPAQKAGKLSGGNQQKVVISKWVAGGSNVLLFDEPTRGIDVGAKAEVFHLMDHLAREGAAILMVSSELPELLQIADRILVMRQGAIAGELPRHCSQEEVLRLAALNGRAAQTP